jgi:hypothetical protein
MISWAGSKKASKLNEKAGETPQQRLTPPVNAAIIAALFDANAREEKQARRIVCWQLATALVVSGIAYGMEGAPQVAIAVLSGGVVSVLNGALLAWRMSRVISSSAHDAHFQLRLLYFYAAERFLVVVALLGLCMAVLKLLPLGVLGGFVMGQTVLMAARLLLNRLKD